MKPRITNTLGKLKRKPNENPKMFLRVTFSANSALGWSSSDRGDEDSMCNLREIDFD